MTEGKHTRQWRFADNGTYDILTDREEKGHKRRERGSGKYRTKTRKDSQQQRDKREWANDGKKEEEIEEKVLKAGL